MLEKIKNLHTALFFISFLIAAGAFAAAAQKSRIMQSGVLDGVPYASTDFENVNLTNGTLNLKFPLAALQGRGEAGFAYYLTYSSKLWRAEVNEIRNQQWGTTYQEFLGDNFEGGWKTPDSYQPVLRDRYERGDHPQGNNCGTNVRWNIAYRWKMEMEMPNGGKVEFNPTGFSDIPPGGTAADGGYFNVRPNGSVTSVTGPTTNCSFSLSTPSGARMTYYSTDGSGMRLTFANAENLGFVWEMSMPDGSRVVQLADRQQIVDRNGNFVESAIVTLPDGTTAPGWVDQFGRFIARRRNSGPNEDSYYQKGVDGQLLTWKVKWKDVYVRKNYTTTCTSCGNQRGPVTNQQAVMEFRVVDRIELPHPTDDLKYVFDYYAKNEDNNELSTGWGEVKSIVLPTEARIDYGYTLSHFSPEEEYDEIMPYEINLRTDQILYRAGRLRNKKLKHTEFYDGVSTNREEIWGYGTSETSSSVNHPDGSESRQYFYDIVRDVVKGGQVYREVKADGTVVERIYHNNFPAAFNYGSGARLNEYVKTEFTTVPDAAGNPALTAIKDYVYDKNNNLLSVTEYDWVPYAAIPRDAGGKPHAIPQNAVAKRTTASNYYNSTPHASDTAINSPNAYWNPTAPRVRNAVARTETAGAAATEIVYDDPSTTANPIIVRNWASTKGGLTNPLTPGNSVTVQTEYDQFGNAVLVTDPNGVRTKIEYGPVNGFEGLYPTEVKTAFSTAVEQTAQTEYDFDTGLPRRVTTFGNKASENVVSETEYDALGRPIKVKTAVGTPLESWTTTAYDDAQRRIIIRSDLETKGDGRKIAVRHFDQLGRVRVSRVLENALTEDPYDETHGIKVQMRYLTANPFTIQLKSNPYRAATASAAVAEESMGWTRSKIINTGKKSETETFTGHQLPAPWGGNAASTGKVKTEIDGNAATITDQALKQKRSITNALGQLTRVDEPFETKDSNGKVISVTLGPVDAPAQPTHYKYNALGKMIEVTQGVQRRHFLYDSLGRLLRVRQPEQTVNSALNLSNGETTNSQWTTGFSYDDNGNILTSTDARNVRITSTYDALNRVLTRSYLNSATSSVNYTYDDPNVQNSKGLLTKVISSISETRYTAYDKMGRLLASEQVTDGRTFASSYRYNLAGIMTEQTYPSNRVVKTFLESDGDIAAISSKVQNGQSKNYASNFGYTATGVVKHLQLGNGLWESAVLNSRHQVTELNMGTSPTDGSKWKLIYNYGEFDTNGNVETAKNSGNIARQTITFSGLAQPFVQSYQYDSLNRITKAQETNGGHETWMQAWSYDRYGNRTSFAQNIGGQQLQTNNLTLPQIDPNTNRFLSGQGYEYDFNGNLKKNAEGWQFTFDGENKQIEVKNSSNVLVGRYFYDGHGKRVKKIEYDENGVVKETIIFVYDGTGKLAAEYSTAQTPTNPTTNYTATDPLGSPRVITDKRGEITSRRDFMPFGEQLAPDAQHRTASLKYNNGDSIRQKFTGYQRDEETELDFAEARYYNSKHGRFTAVDPLLASGKSADPQTFNRYVYTMNRPLILTDPTGLQAAKDLLKPDPSIIVPKNVKEAASQNFLPGTYGNETSVESAKIILPQSLIQFKKDLADFAYTHQAAATSQHMANLSTGDISPNQGTVSKQQTESKESENTKSVTADGEISASPKLGASASQSESNKTANSSSDGKQLMGPSTDITGKLNKLEDQINKAVGNYLNANADRNGNLRVDLIDSSGKRHNGVKISRNQVKRHLTNFAQTVRNYAYRDYGNERRNDDQD